MVMGGHAWGLARLAKLGRFTLQAKELYLILT